MSDSKYCYKNSDVLINKFNIEDQNTLSKMEADLTSIRVDELQNNPIKGKFDFKHLKMIYQYIFQDIYDWAGKERTVEIGKGNLFCTVNCIPLYAQTVFNKYYEECYQNPNDREKFVQALAGNYGDLNALHPFREGNGRTQREFARELCLVCGYDFNLQCTTHQEMLSASILSFQKGDTSELTSIFTRTVTPYDPSRNRQQGELDILTSDI